MAPTSHPRRRRVLLLACLPLVAGALFGAGGAVAAHARDRSAATALGTRRAAPTSAPPASAPEPTQATAADPTTSSTGATVPAPPRTSVPTTPPPSPAAPKPARSPARQPDALRPGSSGPAVAQLQRRLLELGYWLPAADGAYGSSTEQAVLAFQGVAGLARDGTAGTSTRAALAEASRPAARTKRGDAIEIDLRRQVLLVVRAGRTHLVLHTSTGAAASPTRPGRFVVDREVDGVRRAPLGDLYRPKYFDGGIAVHGASSVPGWAASHGCARVSNEAMDLLWSSGSAPLGTPVWVY